MCAVGFVPLVPESDDDPVLPDERASSYFNSNSLTGATAPDNSLPQPAAVAPELNVMPSFRTLHHASTAVTHSSLGGSNPVTSGFSLPASTSVDHGDGLSFTLPDFMQFAQLDTGNSVTPPRADSGLPDNTVADMLACSASYMATASAGQCNDEPQPSILSGTSPVGPVGNPSLGQPGESNVPQLDFMKFLQPDE